ncbi:MAG: hypothetical protein IPF99_41800 [Deltaproteobacteria bacterium]|nr:hypothetical protein [Deltaproteobacteria bacterium]
MREILRVNGPSRAAYYFRFYDRRHSSRWAKDGRGSDGSGERQPARDSV